MAIIDTHTSLIPLNINGLNSPIKRHRLTEWIKKKKIHLSVASEKHLSFKERHLLRIKNIDKKISNHMLQGSNLSSLS